MSRFKLLLTSTMLWMTFFLLLISFPPFYWVAVGEPSYKMRTALSPTLKND